MLIDLKTIVCDIYGKPAKRPTGLEAPEPEFEDFTVKHAIVDCLMYSERDEKLSNDVKIKRYNLAQEIVENDAFEFKDEQKVMIMDLVPKAFPQSVALYGFMFNVFNPKK